MTTTTSSWAAGWRGVQTLWELEMVRVVKAPLLLVATLATPLTWLFLFGLALGGNLRLGPGGVGYAAFLTPGLVVLMGMTFALASGARTMADKQQGFLKEVLVAPVGRMSIILGRTLGICTVVTMQAFLLLGVPVLLGQGITLPYGVVSIAGIAAGVVLVALGFTGVGMLMGVRGKNPQSYQAALGLLTLPMFFLSGAIVPVSQLPAWALPIALVNPMAYAVEVVRQSALGTSFGSLPWELALFGLAGFALLTLSVGAKNLRQA